MYSPDDLTHNVAPAQNEPMQTIPSPVIHHNHAWNGNTDSYSLVCACGCGIESGAGHDSPELAARAVMHGGTRQHPGTPIWDGTIVESELNTLFP